jgi:hypothetical protein
MVDVAENSGLHRQVDDKENMPWSHGLKHPTFTLIQE